MIFLFYKYLGTVTNDWVSPILSTRYGTSFPFAVGTALSFIGLACAFLIVRDLPSSRVLTPGTSSSFHGLISSTKDLQTPFWVAGIVCAFGYAAILPFTSVFVALRPEGSSQQEASRVLSVVFLMCAVFSPIIARGIDRFGRATWVVCASCFLLCMAHSMFLSFDQLFVVLVLGVAYAGFVASIWPLVPMIVTEKHAGLGYGLLTSMQNTALVVVPFATAYIKSQSGSYTGSRLVFLFCGFVALLGSIWLTVDRALFKRNPAENNQEEESLLNRNYITEK
jgi:MFS family permease